MYVLYHHPVKINPTIHLPCIPHRFGVFYFQLGYLLAEGVGDGEERLL
jgi:hypothetical protein